MWLQKKKFQLVNGNFNYCSRKFVTYCCDVQVNFYKLTFVYYLYLESNYTSIS